MTDFWQRDTYKIVEQMKATGNAPGLVDRWKDMVSAWTLINSGPDVEAVKAWLPLWQVRQLYTAAELAPIFPVLAVTLGLRERPGAIKSANRLANELKFAGLPWRAMGTQIYFAVERCHYWREIQTSFWAKEINHAQR